MRYAQLLFYRKLTDSFTFTAIKAKWIECEFVGFFYPPPLLPNAFASCAHFPQYFVRTLHAALLQCANKLLAPIKTEVNFCEMCECDVYTHFDCRINAICHLQRMQRSEMYNLNLLSFFFSHRWTNSRWLAVRWLTRGSLLGAVFKSAQHQHRQSFNEMIFFVFSCGIWQI